MMTESFKQGKLHAGFTFRLLEMIKHVKIQQVPRMSCLVASSVLIAVISIALNLVSFMAMATDSPVMLQMKPWIGEEQISQSETEAKTTMPIGLILNMKIKGDTTNICLGVDNAGVMKIITISRSSDPEQTIENLPPDQAKAFEEAMKQSKGLNLTKTVSISRMRPDGAVIDNSLSRMMAAVTGTLLSTGQASDLFGIGNLQLSILPDKPINVGESWTQQIGTNNNINTKSTLLGFEDIQGQKCAKIQFDMTINMPQIGETKSNSTYYLSVEA